MAYDSNEFLKEQMEVIHFLALSANPQLDVKRKIFTSWPPIWNDDSIDLPGESDIRKVTFELDWEKLEFQYTRKEWLKGNRGFIENLYGKRL